MEAFWNTPSILAIVLILRSSVRINFWASIFRFETLRFCCPHHTNLFQRSPLWDGPKMGVSSKKTNGNAFAYTFVYFLLPLSVTNIWTMIHIISMIIGTQKRTRRTDQFLTNQPSVWREHVTCCCLLSGVQEFATTFVCQSDAKELLACQVKTKQCGVENSKTAMVPPQLHGKAAVSSFWSIQAVIQLIRSGSFNFSEL